MKYIVTGGAGFIGSNLVDALIEQGHEVAILDDLSTGNIKNVNKKATIYKQDISKDLKNLYHIFEDVDCLFHLAAWARVPRSIEDPIGTNKVNVTGYLNILQACRLYNIKIICSSSSSVYGDQNTHIMSEFMSLSPKSPYGLQKVICEQYSELFCKLFDMSIVSLRYFNVYGNRQVTEGAYALVIGKFLEQKNNNKPMTIYGDGTQTRAYTHVSDVIKANILASNIYKGLGHTILNIGTDKETSVNDIAKMIGGKTEHIIPSPRGKFEEMRKCANFILAKELIGWEPKVSIEDGIKELIK